MAMPCIDGIVQDCSISIANSVSQSCTKPSISSNPFHYKVYLFSGIQLPWKRYDRDTVLSLNLDAFILVRRPIYIETAPGNHSASGTGRMLDQKTVPVPNRPSRYRWEHLQRSTWFHFYPLVTADFKHFINYQLKLFHEDMQDISHMIQQIWLCGLRYIIVSIKAFGTNYMYPPLLSGSG